jgi:hypothetical protein
LTTKAREHELLKAICELKVQQIHPLIDALNALRVVYDIQARIEYLLLELTEEPKKERT